MDRSPAVQELAISWRDPAVAASAFVLILLFFRGMSALVSWPNPTNGWEVAVIVAAVGAAVPFVARLLNFLRQSSASIEAPFGLKLDFSTAIRGSELRIDWALTGAVQQGVLIPESGQGELEKAAAEARTHDALVIDLENGQAWYLTRLFAVAAMAKPLGAPKFLIFIGQRDGKARQPIGYVEADDLVRILCTNDPRYRRILAHAEQYLSSFSNPAYSPVGLQPVGLGRYNPYKYIFDEVGNAVFMRVLVEQLINPQPDLLMPGEVAPESGPPWIDSASLEQLLSNALVKDVVSLEVSPKDQVAAILSARGALALAIREGTFQGIIDVELVSRDLLRQLAHRASD